MSNNIREIVTKAVVGKGKKISKETYEIITDYDPSSVLGCWLIDHEYESFIKNGKVYIAGSYLASVWYAYDKDHHTTVYEQVITYEEEINVKTKGSQDILDEYESKCTCLREPACLSAIVNEDSGYIELEIDKEMLVDVIGDASLKVEVSDQNEVWDIDDVNPDMINTSYINDKPNN